MIRILRNLLTYLIWQFMFDSISRVDFRLLFNNLTIMFNTMSTRELIRLYWDIILNKITDNRFYRLIYAQTAINTRITLDRNNKRLFLFSIVFYIIMYRWYILFKKILLWPFKLGIFSFFYSMFGIDVTWLLGWFDIFYRNIPQWVYIQYISLYNNWLGWWHNTVDIKNLKSVSIPSLNSNTIKENVDLEVKEPVESNNYKKK